MGSNWSWLFELFYWIFRSASISCFQVVTDKVGDTFSDFHLIQSSQSHNVKVWDILLHKSEDHLEYLTMLSDISRCDIKVWDIFTVSVCTILKILQNLTSFSSKPLYQVQCTYYLHHWVGFPAFFVWFHIVCDRYTSDYANFTFSDTIWPLSLS